MLAKEQRNFPRHLFHTGTGTILELDKDLIRESAPRSPVDLLRSRPAVERTG